MCFCSVRALIPGRPRTLRCPCWGQLDGDQPFVGSPLGHKVVLPPLPSLLCSHVCGSALSCRVLCPCCPDAGPAVPGSQSSGQPSLAGSQPVAGAASPLSASSQAFPVPMFSLSCPSLCSLGSSGWSAAGTLPVAPGSWSAWLLPLSQFHGRKASIIFGVLLTPAAGASCHAGTLEQSTGISQIAARELPQHQQWEW